MDKYLYVYKWMLVLYKLQTWFVRYCVNIVFKMATVSFLNISIDAFYSYFVSTFVEVFFLFSVLFMGFKPDVLQG